MFSIQQQDAVDFLRSLEPGSVDLIITDPPYSSLEKHRNKGTTTRLKQSNASSNDWFPVVSNEYFPAFFEVAYAALAKNAHLYLYCDDETAYVVKPMGEVAGLKYHKRLVWDKMRIGMGYHYRARCEYILFFEKGKRKLNNLGMPDVFDLKEDSEGYVLECARIARGYPTEKPVMVSERLILQSSSSGELVVDPFMGSGSVGVAALKHGRGFMGCDVSNVAMVLTEQRLSELLSQGNDKQLQLEKVQ